MKTLVIIPAYNEEESIASVVERVNRALPDADVLVINDSSKDRTAEFARETEAKLVSLPVNLGIGGAMQTGYIYAKENGYDFAIQVDGDGQHDPVEIGKLFAVMEKTGVDFVIGSRFVQKTEYSQTFMRRFGIWLFSFFTKLLTGKSIKDATSGFRLANSKVISLFAEYYPSDYPEPEVIVYLHNRGIKIGETPVRMQNRETGTSSITIFKSVYYMIKVTSSMIIQKLRG